MSSPGDTFKFFCTPEEKKWSYLNGAVNGERVEGFAVPYDTNDRDHVVFFRGGTDCFAYYTSYQEGSFDFVSESSHVVEVNGSPYVTNLDFSDVDKVYVGMFGKYTRANAAWQYFRSYDPMPESNALYEALASLDPLTLDKFPKEVFDFMVEKYTSLP